MEERHAIPPPQLLAMHAEPISLVAAQGRGCAHNLGCRAVNLFSGNLVPGYDTPEPGLIIEFLGRQVTSGGGAQLFLPVAE